MFTKKDLPQKIIICITKKGKRKWRETRMKKKANAERDVCITLNAAHYADF